jgi:hypothetical protein
MEGLLHFAADFFISEKKALYLYNTAVSIIYLYVMLQNVLDVV